MAKINALDLHIDVDVLTSASLAEVAVAILEILMYKRYQIPFVYKVFRHFVDQWHLDKSSDSDEEQQEENGSALLNYKLQRQRELAKSTKNSISAIKRLICETFDKHVVKSLRFLFGSTIFTPLECYTINVPIEAISKEHIHKNHRIAQAKLNQIIISFLTNVDLYTIFSHNFGITNLYVEFEILDTADNTKLKIPTQIFSKEKTFLPASCKNVQLYFTHCHTSSLNLEVETLQCCNEMKVLNDLNDLSIIQNDENAKNSNDTSNVEANIESSEFSWWEADIVVRGYKEDIHSKINIWKN